MENARQLVSKLLTEHPTARNRLEDLEFNLILIQSDLEAKEKQLILIQSDLEAKEKLLILIQSEFEIKEKQLATLQNPPVTEHQENIIPPCQDLKQLSKYSNKQPVCVCKEIDHTYTGLKEVYELEISKIKTERDDLLKTCNFEKDELSHQVVLDNGQINQLLVKLKEGEEKQMALSKELAVANEEVANLENSGRELKMELENKEKEYSKKWQEDEKFIVTPYKVREEELLQMIQALEKQVREDQHEKQKSILESTQMIQALEKKVQEYERGKQNMMESQYEFL